MNLAGKVSFDIFLEDRHIPNPDELLGRAIKYLQNQGNTVVLKGFTDTNVPLLEIDGELYSFEKFFGTWEGAHFTKASIESISTNSNNESRLYSIQSFI